MADKRANPLTELLGSKPPAAFSKLTARDRKHLAGVITDAIAAQERAIEAAEDSAVEQVPRPLRGTVRKMLKG